MNAKQAIFDELGDLFGATSEESDAVSNEESGADDGELFLTEEVEGMEAVNEDDSDTTSDTSDAEPDTSDSTAEIDDDSTSDDDSVAVDDGSDDESTDVSDDASDDGSDAGGSANPPDLFDSIYETAASQQESGGETSVEGSGRELTDEERDACIEAATDAITETKMSPEALDWGLNFIQRMYDEKNAKIRARIDSLDWASAKARWEQEDAEEAAREQEERDRYLQA